MTHHDKFLRSPWLTWPTMGLFFLSFLFSIGDTTKPFMVQLRSSGCIADYWAILSGIALFYIISEDWKCGDIISYFLNRILFVINVITIIRIAFCYTAI